MYIYVPGFISSCQTNKCVLLCVPDFIPWRHWMAVLKCVTVSKMDSRWQWGLSIAECSAVAVNHISSLVGSCTFKRTPHYCHGVDPHSKCLVLSGLCRQEALQPHHRGNIPLFLEDSTARWWRDNRFWHRSFQWPPRGQGEAGTAYLQCWAGFPSPSRWVGLYVCRGGM